MIGGLNKFKQIIFFIIKKSFKVLPWQPFTKEYKCFNNSSDIEELIFRYNIMNCMWQNKRPLKTVSM